VLPNKIGGKPFKGVRNSPARRGLPNLEVAMPLYFFDIKNGHRLVDPKGHNLKNDAEAIAKAKVLAIGVSLDKPAVNPTRRIVVIHHGREIFYEAVYSKPHV